MLAELAASHDFTIHTALSPDGAPSPCVLFDAPGSPFYNAESLTESQFLSYLNTARVSEAASPTPARLNKRTPAVPDLAYANAHPIRSFFWRHRVGAIISSLSLFLGAAWLAPLTPSLGIGSGFYNTIHSAYRLVCDQIPERSASIGGLPVCLCWRCTAIYAGSLFFGIVYTIGRDRQIDWLGWLRRPVSLIVMLLFGLPLILDGASHALGFRPGIAYANSPDFWLSWQPFSADWWLRIVTSLLATIGAVKFLCPRLDKLGTIYEQLHQRRRPRPRSTEYRVPSN